MIALYALLLQAFLGALAPPAFAGPGEAMICGHDGTDAPADDPAACRQHECCLPIHAEPLTLAPVASLLATPAWPLRVATRLVWSPADAIAPRAPPDPTASPRGPPAL
ncbi:hypothetical protein [Methylobacterium trifolii]|uniref:hypothetical protein n=1 Tax=Methylobacterium trifolii TaxID=1003092 RepID=UPI001EDF9E13|nr:hypothetical protein [Methylobacterium trifolii]